VRWGLEGRSALVTGGSRGIGRAIVERLAEEGCDVAVNYERSRDKAEAVAGRARELGRRAMTVQADVADASAVDAMRDKVLGQLGRVDILVNNAGIHQHLKSWELPTEDWERVIAVNLTGAYLVSRAFAPHMLGRGSGRIVNISSIVAMSGTDHEAHYAASKAGMHGLTKSLALELGPHGVMVNAIAPGHITTDMTATATEEEVRDTLRLVPLGRLGAPGEIASVVAFLASDEASYITGQVIHVNGGMGLY
jgi:3-oxoacyl-[acyl-carrier protein] reductase